MARPKKEIQEEPEDSTSSGKLKVLDAILNKNKDHHYAFDNNIDCGKRNIDQHLVLVFVVIKMFATIQVV